VPLTQAVERQPVRVSLVVTPRPVPPALDHSVVGTGVDPVTSRFSGGPTAKIRAEANGSIWIDFLVRGEIGRGFRDRS